MNKEERAIRFNVALEIVEKIHSDFCKDEDVTKEQREEMHYFVMDMIHMYDKLN